MSSDRGSEPTVSPPAQPDRRWRRQPGAPRRELRRAWRTTSTSPTPSPRSSLARTPSSITTSSSAKARPRSTSPTWHVHLARSSNFSHASDLAGRRPGPQRDHASCFDGEGCEATLNGLYLASGTQHIDNHTVIDHAKPHCASHELYKGILDGKAHGVFNGKIFVRQDAQKTDAKQTNQTLLLSDDATINTKPQLEIFADDVKCTHGATVGQLERGRDLLPALARHRPGGGPQPAHLRVRQRHRSADPDRAAAAAAGRHAAAGPAPAHGHDRPGGRMSIPTTSRWPSRGPQSAAVVRSRSRFVRRSPSCAARSTGTRSSTSTTPPPPRSRTAVIDAISRYYEQDNANVHRAVHLLEPARHAGVRGCPHQGAALPERRLGQARSSSPAAPPRRSTSSPRPSAAERQGRRRDRRLAHGASLEHRPLADAL